MLSMFPDKPVISNLISLELFCPWNIFGIIPVISPVNSDVIVPIKYGVIVPINLDDISPFNSFDIDKKILTYERKEKDFNGGSECLNQEDEESTIC